MTDKTNSCLVGLFCFWEQIFFKKPFHRSFMNGENLKQMFLCGIIRLQSKLNTKFNLMEFTPMRTLNQKTLCQMAEYIKEYQAENGRSPSYRNIMHYMKMSSLNLVQRYVLALERDGTIERTRLGSIEVPSKLKPSKTTIVPLVGKIACGDPCSEVENIEESFALPSSVFGNGELYMLRAFGNSMIEAGIHKNDLLVIRKQSYANDGDIVVALTNGNNTLKRLYHENGKIVLRPANKKMKDIVVSDCQVQGVLVGCIKTKFDFIETY